MTFLICADTKHIPITALRLWTPTRTTWLHHSLWFSGRGQVYLFYASYRWSSFLACIGLCRNPYRRYLCRGHIWFQGLCVPQFRSQNFLKGLKRLGKRLTWVGEVFFTKLVVFDAEASFEDLISFFSSNGNMTRNFLIPLDPKRSYRKPRLWGNWLLVAQILEYLLCLHELITRFTHRYVDDQFFDLYPAH